jgi:hypothetical protein
MDFVETLTVAMIPAMPGDLPRVAQMIDEYDVFEAHRAPPKYDYSTPSWRVGRQYHFETLIINSRHSGITKVD